MSVPHQSLMTVDELSAAVGLTVRTTRYYASLGLLPTPIRRGRVAYYDDRHRARLELVRALQDHGFTLQAIEGFLTEVPEDAGVEDLALQRAMLTSWTGRAPVTVTHAELEELADRELTDHDVDKLVRLSAIQPTQGGYLALPGLASSIDVLDVDVPEESLTLAADSIRRHMDSLVEDLTDILRTQVLKPYRTAEHSPEDAARMEQTMSTLRQVTLQAVVADFQRAANDVIQRSLSRE